MKFNFGDKVKIKATGKTFIVDHMRLVNDLGVQYWNGLDSGESCARLYNEKELELYQEPQKKKLYAFCDEYGFVTFQTCEQELNSNYKRAPEFDIEYKDAFEEHFGASGHTKVVQSCTEK